MGFETFVVSKYLRSPRKDRSISIITKISILGVAIGVMALIVVLSVMNGFEKDLRGALQGSTGHLTVFSFSAEGIHATETAILEEQINAGADVKAIAPFITNQALIIGKNKPMGTLIKGIDPLKEPTVSQIKYFIRTELFNVKRDNTQSAGNLNPDVDKKATDILLNLAPHPVELSDDPEHSNIQNLSGIIIGSQLAKNLGVEIGDRVTLITPEERITPMGNLPRAKRFQVVGFFESGLMGYDEIMSFVDIKVAQKIYRMQNRVSGLSLKIENGDEADQVKRELQKTISFPFLITSWIEQNKNLFAVFQLEKIGLAIILTLIILVAAFNIISSLVMMVIEKNRDIAILKAMGATNRSIRKIFIIQGSIIGLTGTIIGEVLGVLLCWIISSFDIIDIPPGVYVGNRIPMHVELWQIALIAVVSFFICITVTIFPSQKAASLDPVEGIRNE